MLWLFWDFAHPTVTRGDEVKCQMLSGDAAPRQLGWLQDRMRAGFCCILGPTRRPVAREAVFEASVREIIGLDGACPPLALGSSLCAVRCTS